MTFYCDIDGVLANFLGGCERLFGRTVPAKTVHGWYFYRDWGLTDRSFWARIEQAGRKFWTELELYPWAKWLLGRLERQDEVILATAAAPMPEAWAGRQEWIREKLGDRWVNKTILIPSKLKVKLLRSVEDLLIDDNQNTVRAWRLAGGRAILWPSPGNRHWEFYDPKEITFELNLEK